jgi:putative membrane protein
MTAFLVHLILTAVALLIVSSVVRGIETKGFTSALIAAGALGLANALLKPILVTLTLPITFVTLGLFLLVINAAILMLVGAVVPGFKVRGFMAAFIGSLLLSVLNLVIGWLV